MELPVGLVVVFRFFGHWAAQLSKSSNLLGVSPSERGWTVCERRPPPQSGVSGCSFKQAIVSSSLPVAADSFLLNQFVPRASSASCF